ncbi:peptidoglycan DD-metalloendopeptidase family protein [Adhaeribacter swui]|uniref:Peptidoglycan DD-metalloendopeptidase family protein n=1 Tax=Adhaeribacter swui TaxID=2086471 RepID=A0A7G7GD18_9BACT|nr:peptidoglycan DD-metalloendopeptidase family protein [Adhaeribacter swui]QNF35052.1 peptidoglycan DD-metalloendopeptidase family protein [Adhaeribacter swui]
MLFKKNVYTFYLTILFLLSASSGWAQQKQPKKSNDFFKLQTPKIQYVKPDTTTLIEYEEFHDDKSEANKSIFNPAKKLSIVSEDTTSLDLGEQSIVEISEEVLIDSSWIKIAGYYSIWDTRNINPYRMDGRQIKEPVPLQLVDEARKRFSKMPLETTPITSDFGFRGYRWHYGTDLDLDTGDSVLAAFDGVIRIAAWDGGGYGNYVVVRHYNGLETLYGHMSKTLVKVGQFVKAGQLLGKGGSTGRSTGPHLHFEVRYQGNPIDPERLYDFPEYRLLQNDFVVTAALFNYYNSVKKYKARRAVYHTVRRGEVLGSIARKYGVSVSQLTRLNHISARSTIRAGRRLRVK